MPEEETFVNELQSQFLDSLTNSYVRVTPDYLVGWVYRSWKSTWTGKPDYYCIIPLGHVTAEASVPQPDWKPFVVGHALREALEAILEADPDYWTTLRDRYYLYVRGRGEDGAPLELAFDWYGPGDDEYEESKLVVRFVNRVS